MSSGEEMGSEPSSPTVSGGLPEAAAETPAPAPAGPSLPQYSAKKLAKLRDAEKRKGVVYISRIPPHMKPHHLRSLLEPHAELGRLYLAPEDARQQALRKRRGGWGKHFSEGWIEFMDKSQAKLTAAALNGTAMGGKKRSRFHSDLWCLKYLPKFKWDDLTAEVAYQRSVRERKLDAEMAQAKRERDFYIQQVGKVKGAKAIAERKAKKRKEEHDADDAQERDATPKPKAARKEDAGAGAGADRPATRGGPRAAPAQRRAAEEAKEVSRASGRVLGLLAG